MVADFTGDGHPDFLSNADYSLRLQFWRGNGDGSFAPPLDITNTIITSGTNNLAAADFNGDGKLDLLAGVTYLGVLNFGNGDGTFQTATNQTILFPLPYAPYTPSRIDLPVLVAAADMDGNGTVDVAAADDVAHLVSVLLNDGTGKFLQTNADFSAALDPGTSSIRTADLNGDGLPDIILTNTTTQNVSIFLSIYPKATPTIAIQSSAAQTLVGGSVTVTVQVSGATTHAPTGTVTLASGSTSYGQQILTSSGAATFSLQNLAAGQYPLTATYTGDTYNQGTTNIASFTQSITDFQVALPSATQIVAAGAVATYSVSLTPVAGLSGSVALTCSGLPTGYSCSAAPAVLNGQATTASVTVTPPVTARLEAPSPSRVVKAITFCMLAGLFMPRRRRMPGAWVLLAMLSISLGFLTGCSNGSSASSKPALYTGTSSFIITATTTSGSQSVSHQVAATLTVH